MFCVKWGFIFFIGVGAASARWLPGVNDSLIANSKDFTGQKYGFKQFRGGQKQDLGDTWPGTIGRSTPVRFHGRLHLDTCALRNGHIAFQLFESPQAGKVNEGGSAASLPRDLGII